MSDGKWFKGDWFLGFWSPPADGAERHSLTIRAGPVTAQIWVSGPASGVLSKDDARQLILPAGRLMVAAPELFTALQDLRLICSDIPLIERNPKFAAANQRALQAISKALNG